MTTQTQKEPNKRFYLLSVDLVQGMLVILFVLGHLLVWWRYEITNHSYEGIHPFWHPIIEFLLLFGMAVFPFFVFLFAFNQTNSVLRKNHDPSQRSLIRTKYLKRSAIFLGLGIFKQTIGALLFGPKKILQYLFAWEIFHMFSFSTLFLLVVFEVGWLLQKYGYSFRNMTIGFLATAFTVAATVFLLFHDYSLTHRVTYYLQELNLDSALRYIFIDQGPAPIIPFILFAIVGSFMATWLELPTMDKETIVERMRLILTMGVVSIFVGISLLSVERYSSPALLGSVSSSFLFVAIGLFLVLMPSLIYFLDLDTRFTSRKIPSSAIPLVLLSKVTLTVYIIHNILFVLDPAIIPNEWFFIIIGGSYVAFFILVAMAWQRWMFKYSIEWVVHMLENRPWRSSESETPN